MIENEFGLGETANAIGVQPQTIKNWLASDDLIIGHRGEIKGGGGPGRRRSFSFFAVMQMAMAQAQLDLGIRNLQAAFNAAGGFAHMGTVSAGWVGKEAKDDEPQRFPGLPFPRHMGFTMMIVSGDESCEMLWNPGTDILASAFHEVGKPAGVVIVNATAVFDRVVTRLGGNPYTELSAAYGI